MQLPAGRRGCLADLAPLAQMSPVRSAMCRSRWQTFRLSWFAVWRTAVEDEKTRPLQSCQACDAARAGSGADTPNDAERLPN